MTRSPAAPRPADLPDLPTAAAPSRRGWLLGMAFAGPALLAACEKAPAPAAAPATPPAADAAPSASGAAAASAAPAAGLPATIVVGLDDNFPPMGFKDDKGELTGFDVDLARAAAQRLGVAVQFKPIDWNAKEAELAGKRVDALWNGLTITDERKKAIAFTAPYMQNHQIVIVKAGSPVKAKADLAGKVVGVQDGSSAVDAVAKEDALAKSFKELKKFGDNVTALMDLTAGRLDAVVVDEVVGRYYTAKKPGDYAILEENFGTEDYGVGLRQGDTALHAALDRALADMKADGSAAAIAQKWFGQNILK